MQVDSDNTTNELSYLERVPKEIGREIYIWVFAAEDHDGVPIYPIQTSLLRVNRNISQDSRTLLYGENSYITVSCNKTISEELIDYGIASLASSTQRYAAGFEVRETLRFGLCL